MKKQTQAVEFEPEFIAGLKDIFEEKIPFNKVLGLKITNLTPERVAGRIDMRKELVGHYAFNRIHGGVISAGTDDSAMQPVVGVVADQIGLHVDAPGHGFGLEARDLQSDDAVEHDLLLENVLRFEVRHELVGSYFDGVVLLRVLWS